MGFHVNILQKWHIPTLPSLFVQDVDAADEEPNKIVTWKNAATEEG